jgi:collagen type VI alpha
LDGSGSITPANFKIMLDFCTRLTQTFNFSASGVRMGAVQFSSVTRIEFEVTNNKATALAAIANIKKLVPTGTNIAGGIDLAYKV